MDAGGIRVFGLYLKKSWVCEGGQARYAQSEGGQLGIPSMLRLFSPNPFNKSNNVIRLNLFYIFFMIHPTPYPLPFIQ